MKNSKRIIAMLMAISTLSVNVPAGTLGESQMDAYAAESTQVGLQITKQPSVYVGKIGDTATFSVQANGEGLKY